MALSNGSRVGVYEVVSPLGAGGMGEVYRARDVKLNRDVALKILPSTFAQDPERLARFKREAQVLASLNHPHIGHIYGFEDSADTHALVLELVEGPTLADRIARGPLVLDAALPIAQQIAEALEAAHEQGIVHRDLKPANIKVRDDGTVKVLDFGLAKALDPASPARVEVTNSPTITTPAMMTGVGTILGTAAYMAPEQARGRPLDRRVDIWAFGAVLYEMCSGRAAFAGDTITDIIAAVVTREPDFAAVPSRVRHLLMRCLEKDPKKRLRDIGDAMSLVQGAETSRVGAAEAVHRTGAPRWVAAGGWVTAAALAAGVVAWAVLRPAPRPAADVSVARFQIIRTSDTYNRTLTAFAISPDGASLAYYGAGVDGLQTLLVRTLATGETRQIPGSKTAIPLPDSLFWSPDSRQLVQGAATGSQVLDVAAGTARPLCDCRFVGGSWNRDGVILLGGPGNLLGGIRRLSLADRTLVTVTSSEGREVRDSFPVFLPDGRRFLFTRATPGGELATYLGALDGAAPRRIADGSFTIVMPAAGGRASYLLGRDATGVVAQSFDLDTMNASGTPTTLAAGAVAVSASEKGILITTAAGNRPRSIPTWFDRKGTSLGKIGEEGVFEAVALSSDGGKLAVSEQRGPANAQYAQENAIWLQDLASGTRTRLTFSEMDGTPVWSPDGNTIAFSSRRGGVGNMFLPYQRAANGVGHAVPLFAYDRNAWVNDWSNDGRWVIFSSSRPGSAGNNLWAVLMERGSAHQPVQYLAGAASQQQAQFSPDGRFVAYGSAQSGTWEIYVQPFPNASEGKWMVSTGGGAEPRWSRDGRELFYFSGQTLMVVPVSVQPTFSSGTPTALFDAPVQTAYFGDSHRWQVAPDGKRFLLLVNAGDVRLPPLDVLVNWPMLLKK